MTKVNGWGSDMISKRFGLAFLAVSALYSSSAQAVTEILPDAIYNGALNMPGTLPQSSEPINASTSNWSVSQAATPNPTVSASTTGLLLTPNNNLFSGITYFFEIVHKFGDSTTPAPVLTNVTSHITLSSSGGASEAEIFVAGTTVIDATCGVEADDVFCGTKRVNYRATLMTNTVYEIAVNAIGIAAAFPDPVVSTTFAMVDPVIEVDPSDPNAADFIVLTSPGIGNAVPEPATWAMMLVGFAGLCFAGYRRSLKPVSSAV